jgi:hypothetical protein
VCIFLFRLVLRRMRENEKIADLIHDVYIGSCGLASFPRWLVREGGLESSLAFLFLCRGILVSIFGFSRAADGNSFGRFRSLDCLRLTDGELSINLWNQAVSGTALPPASRLRVDGN